MSETDLMTDAKWLRYLAGTCVLGLVESDENRLRSIAARLEQLTAERDHWKANHDEAVRVKRTLLDRPDLAERATLVQELIRERDEAVARVKSLSEQTEFAEYAVVSWLPDGSPVRPAGGNDGD